MADSKGPGTGMYAKGNEGLIEWSTIVLYGRICCLDHELLQQASCPFCVETKLSSFFIPEFSFSYAKLI